MAISDAFRTTYDLAFQVSPIILVGGIAANTLGGMLPIIALGGQALSALQGAVSGGLSTDDFFARYIPIPGSTLVNQQIATYPFANQSVAANATIQQALNISLQMICPVKDTAGYLTKLSIITSLQNSLVAHNAAGGLYHVATPGYVYTNLILTGMTDVTGGDTNQKMMRYQLDFVQPLVTKAQAASTFSALMGKLNSGAQITAPTVAGTSIWSNASVAVGAAAQNAVSNITGLTGVVNNFLSSPL